MSGDADDEDEAEAAERTVYRLLVAIAEAGSAPPYAIVAGATGALAGFAWSQRKAGLTPESLAEAHRAAVLSFLTQLQDRDAGGLH